MPVVPAAFGGPGTWVGIAALGLSVGIIAGMFGVGGGFLLVPLLNIVFRVPLEIAAGTGMCQMCGIAVAAFRRYRKLRQGEVKIDWIMLGGGLIGVTTGAEILAGLGRHGVITLWGHSTTAVKFWLSFIYILLLGSVAAWIINDSRVRPAGAPIKSGPLTRIPIPPYTRLEAAGQTVSVLVIAYIGLLLGLLSGILGIGGGAMLMPILLYGIGMRLRMAAGTGLLMLLCTSLTGTLAHARLGHVNLPLAMILLAGSTIGAPIGASITAKANGQRMRGIFGVLVLVTAAVVLWDLLRVMAVW